MGGAQLQIGGQIRNIAPVIVNTNALVTLTIPVASFVATEQPIRVNTTKIPHDLGPDKSDRVFIVVNNLACIVSADAGTTSALNGFLYFRGNGADKIYLASFAQVISAAYAFNAQITIGPDLALTAPSVDNIGFIGFDNNASVAGTATNIIVKLAMNIGLYGEYAEDDLEQLFVNYASHEHTGLVAERITE